MSNKKSKYYYDYTRNMSDDKIKNNKCCKPICDNPDCKCEEKPFDTSKWKESVRKLNKSKFDKFKDTLKGYTYWLNFLN